MFWQRNDTGGVLESHEFGLSIGPGEEFGCSLPVPGCTILGRSPDEDSGPGIRDAAWLSTTGTGITEDPSGEESRA